LKPSPSWLGHCRLQTASLSLAIVPAIYVLLLLALKAWKPDASARRRAMRFWPRMTIRSKRIRTSLDGFERLSHSTILRPEQRKKPGSEEPG